MRTEQDRAYDFYSSRTIEYLEDKVNNQDFYDVEPHWRDEMVKMVLIQKKRELLLEQLGI